MIISRLLSRVGGGSGSVCYEQDESGSFSCVRLCRREAGRASDVQSKGPLVVSVISAMLAISTAVSLGQGRAPASPQQNTDPRVEITRIDNWTVTCNTRINQNNTPQRTCLAEVELIHTAQNGARNSLLFWQLRAAEGGRIATTMRVPTGLTLQAGLSIKAGNRPARKFDFATCEPRYCEARPIIDDAIARELSAVRELEVTVTSSGGQSINFNLPISGIDRAIASIRAR